MHRPPPLRALPRFPVTAGTGLLALAASLLWWWGADVEVLLPHPATLPSEPWRLFSSALLHVSPFHLLFDLYWLWAFGSLVEGRWGHGRALLLFLVLQAGSAAAETALLRGGVGLSGIGYGLFGLLWVLARRDRRFQGAVDRPTVWIFVGWAFAGLATTAFGLLETANAAHLAGLSLGALLGAAVASREPARGLWGAAALGVTAAALLGAGPLRPRVNLAGEGTALLELRAAEALEAHRPEEARALLERAVAAGADDADAWFNLGLAREQAGEPGAEAAFRAAFERAPERREARAALAGVLADRGRLLLLGGDPAAAEATFREALEIDGVDANLWGGLGLALHRRDRPEEGDRALARAEELDPAAALRWTELRAIDAAKAERADGPP